MTRYDDISEHSDWQSENTYPEWSKMQSTTDKQTPDVGGPFPLEVQKF